MLTTACLEKLSSVQYPLVMVTHRIAGNFRGIQFSQKGHLQRFHDLIFMDGCSRTAAPTIQHALWSYPPADRACAGRCTDFYFADLIFMDCCSTMKTAKIGSLKISSYTAFRGLNFFYIKQENQCLHKRIYTHTFARARTHTHTHTHTHTNTHTYMH